MLSTHTGTVPAEIRIDVPAVLGFIIFPVSLYSLGAIG